MMSVSVNLTPDKGQFDHSEPAKKSAQNIPKNRCRTTIAERMVETLAELPFIGDQVVRLSRERRSALPPGADTGALQKASHTRQEVKMPCATSWQSSRQDIDMVFIDHS